MKSKYKPKKVTMRILLAIAIFAITGTAVCYGGGKYTGGPYYYRDIKEGVVPYEPIGEINYEEANNLYTYYEAYFDTDGKIVSLKKYQKGKLEQDFSPSGKK